MATDLYIVDQTDRRPAVSKREINHWFGGDDESIEPSIRRRPVMVDDVNVVIGDGNVFVSLGKGQIVQRSYAAITTCFLCKLDQSNLSPPTTKKLKRPKEGCVSCRIKKEAYHRLAELRVRNALRMGYQRMYGPFNLNGTAPFPFKAFEDTSGDELVEIVADCEADLKVGRERLIVLKRAVSRGYQQMSGYEKMILVRKFGANVFKPAQVAALSKEAGKGDVKRAQESSDPVDIPSPPKLETSETPNPNRSHFELLRSLATDQQNLREIRGDVDLYRKVWKQVKSMGYGQRKR